MISCKEYTQIMKQKLKEEIGNMKRKPKLCVVQINNDTASNSYIKGKHRDCEEVGVEFLHIHIQDSENVSEEELANTIRDLNEDNSVDGIIIQLPIPEKYNIEYLQQCISPRKDVDGFRKDSHFNPCTPKGIIDWLDYNQYKFDGKVAVVIGRSKIVGKPLVNMLIDKGVTVTCCNSRTKMLGMHTNNADLIITAVGKPKHFDYGYFCYGWSDPDVIIDVGINKDKDGNLCGDIDTEYMDRMLPNTYVTPVPGGVGLLTRLALIENVVKAYKGRT